MVFGEGEGPPLQVKQHCVPIRPKEIRYTHKNNVLYAISLNKPELPLLLIATKDYDLSLVKNIFLLGSVQEVKWRITENGISIDGPSTLQGNHVYTFKIEHNVQF